ncbi:MAG TPA: patatin-like phospholipase family protein, partial [Pirellulaceae bacterium]|nr:patatin-like phospholipase family protein [Pirellulaceae bacterium]
MKLAALTSSTLSCWLVVVLAASLSGCVCHHRACAPTSLIVPDSIIDLNDSSEQKQSSERELLQAALARLKVPSDAAEDANDRQYQVLALSGGGSHGAFSAGVINGWTASGQRPVLDIVSGVSTGALISTYAFLGSEYDDCLRELFTQVSKSDIYRTRPKVALLWQDSAATSAPLQRLIENHITPEVVSAVAEAHAQGRRLYVGTTNLDTSRLVIWNMGAIASSGRDDAIDLYRQVILASASVPGFFPPVSIDVTVNDRIYTEMHADGGTTSQVFFRSSMLDLDVEHFADGRRPLVGSRIYILVAGKTHADPKCVKPKVVDVAKSSLGALTYAQTRNDLIRIYMLTMLSGMEYRVAAIPQELKINENALSFKTEE